MHLRPRAPGVFVATSDMYLTTTTVVAAGSRCLLIDPALLPGELAALEEDLRALGLVVEAGVSTHAHWDHLLWSRGLGDAPRFASRAAIDTLARNHKTLVDDSILGAGERWYAQWDSEVIGRLTEIPSDNVVPWSGPRAVLVTHDGHAPGHSAVYVAELGVLAAGDMLSDVEIPGLDWDQPEQLPAYTAGLDRLEALDGVRLVIPGHGHAGDAAELKRRVAADRSYLSVLAAGGEVADSRLDGFPPMRRLHDGNVEGLARQRSTN